MTARAGANHIVMIHDPARPRSCLMTCITSIGGVDVGCRFTHRRRAIVAGSAGPQHVIMVDCLVGVPRCRRVAVLANIVRRNMGYRFSGRRRPVVTRNAVARYPSMVEHGSHERARIVAINTRGACGNMGCRFADRLHAIMATCTRSRGRAVVKLLHCPIVGGVTRVALRLGGDMRGIFADCKHVIMAGRARSWRSFEYGIFVARLA